MAALLLVDDDAPIRRMLERTLAAEGYDVEAAADGGAALAAVERSVPDAIVLDVTMPGLDGLAGHAPAAREGPARADPAADRPRRGARARRRARRRRRRLPGQAVRRRRAERARARAAAAQRAPRRDARVRRRDARRAASARRAGRDLELTPREADLLELLLRNARGVVTRELALDEVWGGEGEATLNAVDRYVAYLRRKLGDPPLIHTVRGVGFRLDRRVTLRDRVALAAAAAIVLALALLVIAVPKLLARRPAQRRSTTRCAAARPTSRG